VTMAIFEHISMCHHLGATTTKITMIGHLLYMGQPKIIECVPGIRLFRQSFWCCSKVKPLACLVSLWTRGACWKIWWHAALFSC